MCNAQWDWTFPEVERFYQIWQPFKKQQFARTDYVKPTVKSSWLWLSQSQPMKRDSHRNTTWKHVKCEKLWTQKSPFWKSSLLKRLFVRKLKILYSSDHPILIKFRQLVVNIVIKELQMVFLTSTVNNSNGNMKELERKIKCEKLMFR